MAYVKNIWVDQDVERPKTYEVTNNQDGSITLTDSFGLVTELGTPVNETNMNHIEEGIEGCAIRKHNLTETFNAGEWVLGGTGDNEGIYKSLIPNNVGNALTDSDSWEKVKMGGSSRNVGEIISSTLPLTDAGLHLLDGTLLPYGIYKEFIDYIADLYTENPNANYFCTETEWQASVLQYGSCGKYVYDSTLNTVRLPRVSDIIQCTTDLTALGNLIEAGLPDITGTVSSNGGGENLSATGAFKSSTNGTWAYAHTRNEQPAHSDVRFKASDSNPIYGNNTTVQPQTIQGLVYVVIATSSKTNIQVDIDEIATDLNRKADVDLTNVNNQAKILMSGMGAVDISTYDELTLGASGSTYIAPANGCFQVSKLSTAAGQQIKFYIPSDDTVAQKYIAQGTGQPVEGFSFLCLKGQVIGVNYSLAGVTNHLRFYYAKGSESEAQ